MPKKIHSKGNPRKFTDKIALIKHKEAITNASFQSAINGLNGITMNLQPCKDTDFAETTDNYSCNSYSPESFSSESTAMSFNAFHPPTNEYGDMKKNHLTMDNNNQIIKSCHELSNINDTTTHQTYNEQLKFRNTSDKPHLQTQESRHSNIEGYYPHNKILAELREPISSGSLPDISIWSSPKEFPIHLSDESKNSRNSFNKEHINLQETLYNLKQMKSGMSSKMAILEHLKNRGVHGPSTFHPHHIPSPKDPATSGLPSIISTPSFYRAEGHGHNHADYDCAGNQKENGHLKHYSAANSPYISQTYRDKHNINDVEAAYRTRHMSGNPYSSINYPKLNIDCCNDIKDYETKSKALTPEFNQSNQWFNNIRNDINPGLLHPPSSPNVLINENWRRVASESSIQNSLKYSNDKLAQQNNIHFPIDNSFQRVNSLKRDSLTNQYLRNQSLTSYPIQNTQNLYETLSNNTDLQRELSQVSVSSSFLDNLLALKSPDENLDPLSIPDIKLFQTPDYAQNRVFMFNELKEPTEDNQINNFGSPNFVKKEEYVQTEDNCTHINSDIKQEEIIYSMNCDNPNTCNENAQDSDKNTNSHECYWGQSNDDEIAYEMEPSPKIKACENLDPKTVPVDLFTDFSNITEMMLDDEEMHRRDSLNWTDEVLKGLNNESTSNDSSQSRDRAMSICQTLIPLIEEDVVNNFVDVNES